MIRETQMLVATMFLSSVVMAAEVRLPRTLNFENITATHINQTVGETPSNEKEVAFGDFDNDGDLDVVIANAQSDFGQRRNKLYRNDGGVFNEISGSPAIPGFTSTDVTRNAFFRDFNQDGWLDILIINDSNTGGQAGRTKVYINYQVDGEFDHFTDEGLARVPGNAVAGPSCSAQAEDFDNDGDYDFYSGNYPNSSQDQMFFNDGNGFFTKVTNTHVPADGAYTIDVSSADMNGDGKLDLLISNWNPNYVYYNDNNDAGSEVGDYRYSGSQQSLGAFGALENSMEPIDVNNDGLMDIYAVNKVGAQGQDRILLNTGNNANNMAIFSTLSSSVLPPNVLNKSVKATVADFNNDGRMDLLVTRDQGRPTVLRNVTAGSDVRFVDWTPGDAFPSGTVHKGWHAAAFDTTQDGWDDIFLGGWNNDHLFKNVISNQVEEADLVTSQIPAIYNTDPVAVMGEVDGEDVFEVAGVPSGSVVSVVLTSCSDLTLELTNSSGTIIGTSSRVGMGVDEAVQITAPSGAFFNVHVIMNQACGDWDGDGDIDGFDFEAFSACADDSLCNLPEFDFDLDGDVDFGDFSGLQAYFTGKAKSAAGGYVLEILARN